MLKYIFHFLTLLNAEPITSAYITSEYWQCKYNKEHGPRGKYCVPTNQLITL